MNKLLTNFNGGYPIDLDDLRFRDEAYRNAIQNFASSLATHAILTGCEITENTQTGLLQVSQGWVVVDGEIGYLPLTTGLDETYHYAIIADNYVDNSVVKVLQSGQSVKPNEIRQFKIESWHPSMNVEAKLWGLKSMIGVLKQKLEIPTNQLIETTIIDTPPLFAWISSEGVWRTKMPHNLTSPFYKLRGTTVLVEDSTSNTNKSLPVLMGYEVDDTYIHFIEYNPQGSSSTWRSLIENNGIKCVFRMLP